jgi:ABC-type antimicrobial peptide transport system permease subunit
MRSILFEVPSFHIATLAGAAFIIGAASVTACWLPARRAARVDPMVALRSE